jgi:hypothetical protein
VLDFIGSSLNRVGDFWGWMSNKSVHCLWILLFWLGLEFGINDGWHEQRSEAGGFGIRIRSLVFDRNKQCAGFSVIRRCA